MSYFFFWNRYNICHRWRPHFNFIKNILRYIWKLSGPLLPCLPFTNVQLVSVGMCWWKEAELINVIASSLAAGTISISLNPLFHMSPLCCRSHHRKPREVEWLPCSPFHRSPQRLSQSPCLDVTYSCFHFQEWAQYHGAQYLYTSVGFILKVHFYFFNLRNLNIKWRLDVSNLHLLDVIKKSWILKRKEYISMVGKSDWVFVSIWHIQCQQGQG